MKTGVIIGLSLIAVMSTITITIAMANPAVQNQTTTNQTQLEKGRVGERIGGTAVGNVTATTTATTATSSSNFLQYENSTYGIRVQYPSDWLLEEKDYYPGDGITDIVTFFSPLQGRMDDYAEEVYVSKESNPVENVTLDEYADIVIDYLNDTTSAFNLVEITTNNVTLSGFPAYRLVSTQSIEDIDNSVKGMEVGTITPKNEAYFISYYGEENGQYSQYLPIVQKMIDSFEIVNDPDIGEESPKAD